MESPLCRVVEGELPALPGTSKLPRLTVGTAGILPLSGLGLATTGNRNGLPVEPSVDLSRRWRLVGAGDLARCRSLLMARARASIAARREDSSVLLTARWRLFATLGAEPEEDA